MRFIKHCPQCGEIAPNGNCLPCADRFADRLPDRVETVAFKLLLFMVVLMTALAILASVLYIKTYWELQELKQKQCAKSYSKNPPQRR